MKLIIKLIASLLQMTLSKTAYQSVRSYYYSLKRHRLSSEVEAEGFIVWYAEQIDCNAPRMADRITKENIQTGSNDLNLLRSHGLKKNEHLVRTWCWLLAGL